MPYQSKVSCISHKQSTEHSINYAECGVRYLPQFQQYTGVAVTQLTRGFGSIYPDIPSSTSILLNQLMMHYYVITLYRCGQVNTNRL